MRDENLIAAHSHCSNHKNEIESSSQCACFACLKIFTPSDITEWFEDEGTAVCPYCSVDAVIGDKSGYPVTDAFLADMKKRWF